MHFSTAEIGVPYVAIALTAIGSFQKHSHKQIYK